MGGVSAELTRMLAHLVLYDGVIGEAEEGAEIVSELKRDLVELGNGFVHI